MDATPIVTSFLEGRGPGGRPLYLLLRRSPGCEMGGLWSGISGALEGGEAPLSRARAEILEEVGLDGGQARLGLSAAPVLVESPEYAGRRWMLFPFLFEHAGGRVRLNRENAESRWVAREDLAGYRTVPRLAEVLDALLGERRRRRRGASRAAPRG